MAEVVELGFRVRSSSRIKEACALTFVGQLVSMEKILALDWLDLSLNYDSAILQHSLAWAYLGMFLPLAAPSLKCKAWLGE